LENIMFKKLAIASALVAAATTAQAQDSISAEVGVSTLGAYVAPSFALRDNLRLRLPVYFGNYSDTFDVEGNRVKGSLELNSAHIMADYYIGNGGFRVSGGLSMGGYKVKGSANSLTFNGTTYTPTTGSLEIKAEQERNVAPVAAIGYQKMFGNGNWGISGELGARLTKMEFSSNGQANLPTQALRDSYANEVRKINDDLQDFAAVPFVSVGVVFNF
jgi:hypothetical protein